MAAMPASPQIKKTSDFADLMIGMACGAAIVVTALLLALLVQRGGLPSSCDFAALVLQLDSRSLP